MSAGRVEPAHHALPEIPHLQVLHVEAAQSAVHEHTSPHSFDEFRADGTLPQFEPLGLPNEAKDARAVATGAIMVFGHVHLRDLGQELNLALPISTWAAHETSG